MSTQPRLLRVVIVGAGPRALFALEALAARGPLARTPGTSPPVTVTVLDPTPHPGTGSAYSPDQPEMLRLNVASGILDAPAGGGADFTRWARRHAPAALATPYPPRAVVGRYLADRWRALVETAPFPVRVRPVRARSVRRAVGRAGEWEVVAEAGPPEIADELLLTTGHARDHTGALARTWPASSPLRLIPRVLPAAELLDPRTVAPGARIAVRGGALTFLDAVLALTLGRGGTFEERREGAGDPGGLVHVRGPAEPAVLLPLTRRGLFLDAKPDPAVPLPPGADAVLRRGGGAVRAAHGEVAGILAAVTGTASDLLALADPSVDAAAAVDAAFGRGEVVLDPDLPVGRGRAEAALRRSVLAAQGIARGPSWALGRAWSGLYGDITAAMRDCDAPREEFMRFRTAAAALERCAFGPPLASAQRLLATIRSGAVDPTWMDAGVPADPVILASGPEGLPAPDAVLDAVLAPPGVTEVLDPLLASLCAQGLLTVRPGRRGARVDGDGTLRASSGERAEHLALVGRACEDHVIGHDTLNRHLHPDLERWAARVARRAVGPAGTHGPTTRTETHDDHP